MSWTLPGTVLTIPRQEASAAQTLLEAMFLAGGISLRQVCAISGLEGYTVQNWVKRGFLTPPAQKRYTLEQLTRVLLLNALKDALPMEQICRLSSCLGCSDTRLYFLFVRRVAEGAVPDLPEGPACDVLDLMDTAYTAGQLKLQAQARLSSLL